MNESIKEAEKQTNVIVTEIQVNKGYIGHDYIGIAKVSLPEVVPSEIPPIVDSKTKLETRRKLIK